MKPVTSIEVRFSYTRMIDGSGRGPWVVLALPPGTAHNDYRRDWFKLWDVQWPRFSLLRRS